MSEKLKVLVLEGADNKLDLAKLEDVLRRKLTIPSYQRPYAWTPEDIEEIFQTIKLTEENKEDISFFGSIILSQKSNGFGQEEYYIIDGQQRLVSFLLILKVVLMELELWLEKLTNRENLSKKEIRKQVRLESFHERLLEIIRTVNLTREFSDNESDEQSILHFIKKGDDCDNLPNHLDKKINTIYNHSPLCYEEEWPDSNVDVFKYIDKILYFLDQILNKIKFCLISITGENSEDFSINLFNTLNTTGQPLTAFEVLKSELYKIDPKLSKQIDNIQSEIIKKYVFQRKKITTHTGKLLLYLPLYRGDFKSQHTLSDKKFKDQRGYLKEVLNQKIASQLVENIKDINRFYSDYWLKLDSLKDLLKKDDEQVCFQFLSELTHDRVLPIMLRFHKNNKESLGKCVKMCTAFSSLWRAFHDGGTSGVDKAYEDISLSLKADYKIKNLNKKLKELFLKKLSSNNIQELKKRWLEKLKISSIYKNQKLSKFLLFIAYNQLHFDPKKGLKKGSGVDILNLHYWKHEDYKTIEHIIPKAERKMIGHVHTLGNLTLLPQALNSSLGNKPFSEKLKEYKQFCLKENEDKYPYLPTIEHIAHYNQFEKKEIEERSKILSQFIWKTLVEDWLGWKSEGGNKNSDFEQKAIGQSEKINKKASSTQTGLGLEPMTELIDEKASSSQTKPKRQVDSKNAKKQYQFFEEVKSALGKKAGKLMEGLSLSKPLMKDRNSVKMLNLKDIGYNKGEIRAFRTGKSHPYRMGVYYGFEQADKKYFESLKKRFSHLIDEEKKESLKTGRMESWPLSFYFLKEKGFLTDEEDKDWIVDRFMVLLKALRKNENY